MMNYNIPYVNTDPVPAWMKVDNYQDFILPMHTSFFGFLRRR